MSYASDMGYDVGLPYRGSATALKLDPETLRLYWTTKNRDKIFIEDMETSHIENICKAGINGKIDMDEKSENRLILELSIRRRA